MDKQPYDLESYRAGFRDGMGEKAARYADSLALSEACWTLLGRLERREGEVDEVEAWAIDELKKVLQGRVPNG